MVRFILSKLLYLIPTFLGITIIAFGFVRILPGDPVLLMAGERGVSPSVMPNSARNWVMTSRW